MSEVINIRIDIELLKLIKKAAKLSGLSLSAYIRYCAIREANKIIGLKIIK